MKSYKVIPPQRVLLTLILLLTGCGSDTPTDVLPHVLMLPGTDAAQTPISPVSERVFWGVPGSRLAPPKMSFLAIVRRQSRTRRCRVRSWPGV